MSLAKYFLTVAVSAGAFCAFADAKNQLISFSTEGIDRYADGSQVLDGEWYALVWSADGVFDGLNIDSTPVDKNDAVVMMASLAKGGRCPYTVFQLDSSEVRATGEYAVYMLDTRNASKTAVAARDPNTGRPVFVNGEIVAKSYAATASLGVVAAKDGVATSGWAASAVDTSSEDFTQAKITAFRVVGSKVELKVAGMMPGVQYNVQMGSAPNALTTYALSVPKTSSDNDATFELDKNDAQFFRVVREPLSK